MGRKKAVLRSPSIPNGPHGQLTPKQREFVLRYCGLAGDDPRAKWSPKWAAIGAGYSERSAAWIGHDMLKVPKVRHAVDSVMAGIREQDAELRQRAIDELARLAFSSITDVMDVRDGTVVLRDVDDIPRDAAVAIMELSQERGDEGSVRTKVRLHGKIAALRALLDEVGGRPPPLPTVATQVNVVQQTVERGPEAFDPQAAKLRALEILGIVPAAPSSGDTGER